MAENEIALRIKFASEGGQQVVQNVDAIADSAQKVENNFEQADESAAKLGETASKVASGELVESTNKLQGAMQGLQSGLRAIGLGGVGEKLQGLVGFGDTLKNIGEQAGLTATVSAALPPGLAAAAGGFVAVAAPLVAVAAVAAPAVIALKLLVDTIAAQKTAVDSVVNGLSKDTDARLAAIEVMRTATSEQIKNSIETQKLQLEQIKIDKAHAEAFAADMQRQYEALGSSFDPVTRAALGQAGQVAAASIADLTSRADVLTKSIDENTKTILPAVEAREKETKARENETKATSDLVAQQQRLSATNFKRTVDDLTEFGTNANKIIDLTAKRSAQVAERVQADTRAGEIAGLEAAIESAKQIEDAKAAQNRITAIRQEGAQAEAEAAIKVSQRVADINRSYMENELKALDAYRKTEERATEDYNKNRARKLADLYDTLSDLAGKGDVAAFVSAQKQGMKDISRGDEDAGDAAQRRRQDYDDQRKAAQDARDQQLADLMVSAAQETAARQAQLAQRLKQEEAADKVQMTQSQKLQKDLADLRARYAREDLAAKRKEEDDAYNITINGLQRRQQQLGAQVVATFTPAVTSIQMIGTAVATLIRTAVAALPGGSTSSSATASSARNNYVPPSSRNGLTVNVNANFGDIVTPSQMNSQIHEVVQGIKLAVSGG